MSLFITAMPVLAEEKPVRVLVVESFAAGAPISVPFNQTFSRTLQMSAHKVDLDIVNLDSLRFKDPATTEALYEYIARKYNQSPPDYLVSPESASAHFILTKLAPLFPHTPLIYVDASKDVFAQLEGQRNIYPVSDKPDYQGNIQLIKRILPEAQELVVLGVALSSETLKAQHEELANARQSFTRVTDMTKAVESQYLQALPTLSPRSVVMIGGFLMGEQGQVLEFAEAVQKIIKVSPVPVFSLFDVGPESGVTGGKMISPTERGKAVAEQLLKLLDNSAAASTEQTQRSFQPYIFDYAQLKRFGLEDRLLPEGSIIRHLPKAVFESNPRFVIAAAGLLMALVFVVAYLFYRFYVRHAAGVRLTQRAASYRVLFEDNPAPMLVYEPQSREILAINQAFTRIFGFSLNEIVGAPFGSLLVEQQREAMNAAISRLNSEQAGPASSQWLVNTSNGEQRNVEVLSRPLEFAGKQARVVQMSDITERLATEEKIRQREQLLHQIIENSPLPTLVLDAQQQVTDWNFALELLSRLPARNMVGKRHNLGLLIGTPDGGPTLVECMLQGLDPDDPLGSGVKRGVFRSATLTDGLELEVFNSRLQRWTHSIAVPLRKPDGTLLGAIQSALDVTELRVTEAALQKVNEELEQRVQQRTDQLTAANEELQRAMQQLVQSEKLAALGGLVAGVAHELNTPIGNAMTVVTTLSDHLADFRAGVESNALRRNQITSFIETCSEACIMLERNTQRAAELVASFKQVAVDQTSMRRRQFSVREAVDETLLTVAPGYKHEPVTVTHSIPENLELDSYPGALEQAISTLVDNAVKHARVGRPQLSIIISAQAASLRGVPAVSISVQDDGIGMTQEVARKVFDPFFTTQLGHGGSGLGLYVVYSLVTSVLGGSISLRTLPELGSCFTLLIPLVAPLPDSAEALEQH